VNTSQLASLIRTACRTLPDAGWFNNDRSTRKAWIHAAYTWTKLIDQDVSLEAFKALLVAANRDRTLDLARCDLVEACDPYDVRRSATFHMGAEYNFIRVA
jgi:hypothetical protein